MVLALYFGLVRTRLGVVHFQFSGCFFDFLPLNLVLVRSHQAEIIILSALSKDATTCTMMAEVEPRSRNRDHTVAIKTAH